MTTMKRRDFVISSGATLTGAALLRATASAAEKRPPRILLRSSWQTVNIGDIAHSPGVVQLLNEHIPDAEVFLWPSNIGDGVEEILRKNFPKLQFVQGAEAVRKAFAECDFLLHGSGPSLVAQKHVAQWRKETGKPYGVYGITLPSSVNKEDGTRHASLDDEGRAVLDDAKFLFLRDTISLKMAQETKLKCPIMEFGPDGAFAVKLRNDEEALQFMKANGLEDGKFICAIPRLRNTPYWEIRKKEMTDLDRAKHKTNEEFKERDHVKLREAIMAFVKETGLKVLVCPEDHSHMQVGKEMLINPLPDAVKKNVVWHEKYWLTDEAVSTYVRALALLSMDMHSPIMAVGNGTPSIHCRFAQQTTKGQMWRDIGLGEWLFDMDEEKDGTRITAALLAIAKDPPAAKTKVGKAMEFVRQRQRETMAIVANAAKPV
jgi:polysaccharide pyruvyl transferase WcaK-like protein